jgi:peptidoglycan/LPS O-acetylase OafA/YrhL
MLVLAGHLLPLSPGPIDGNSVAATAGMALFFVLSGYFVTRILEKGESTRDFLIRRVLRIVPLAYLFALVVFVLFAPDPAMLRNTLLFVLNYANGPYVRETGHLWSLCVEMQFYLVMAALYLALGSRAKWVILAATPCVTGLRVLSGDAWSTMTHLRCDELLAGSLLYLTTSGAFGDLSKVWRRLGRALPLIVVAFLLTCSPQIPVAPLLRAYPAALVVGAVLALESGFLLRVLTCGPMTYVAKVSYAVYVVHLACASGWLAGGDKVFLYTVKRPISFALTFLIAHVSTHYYEAFWNRLAHRWTQPRAGAVTEAVSPRAA